MLLERMSQGLQVPDQTLYEIGRRAAHSYKTYAIAKRDGHFRIIHHPSRQLKMAQRWLLRMVIEQWPVHDAASAYRPARGIREHASLHAGGRFLLRMDFENFFPSLLRRHVAAYLANGAAEVDRWTPEDRNFFLDIVCKGAALTIGAPTSPALSNALCFDLDRILATIAAEKEVTYSRHSDDLFFSTGARDVLRGLVLEVKHVIGGLALPDGLLLNEGKTHHTSRKWRRQVTGLLLTPDGALSLGRHRKRRIRGLIHRYHQLTAEEQSSLRGFLAFARSIEPDLINRLVLKYGAERIDEALGSRR